MAGTAGSASLTWATRPSSNPQTAALSPMPLETYLDVFDALTKYEACDNSGSYVGIVQPVSLIGRFADEVHKWASFHAFV